MSTVDALPGGIVRDLLGRAWWAVLLRGLAAILFGLISLALPHISLLSLVFLYAAYAVADGILSIAAAIRGGGFLPRWWLALAGVVSLAAGAAAAFWPGVTAIILAIMIGVWAIVRGVIEIMGAITLRKTITNEWWLGLAGLVSILFGAMLVMSPGAGALALVWVIGVYAVALGVLLTLLAFRLRRLHHA